MKSSQHSPLNDLLSKLDDVRDRGHGQYFARCPAHDDKIPSLSIKETGDGTVLIKCFPGCSAAEIVSAVGMELKDLFPDNCNYHQSSKSPRWNPRDILKLLYREATVVMVTADDMSHGRKPDIERVTQAYQRICKIVEESNVHG